MNESDTIKPSEGFDYYNPETVFFNSFDIFAQDWNRQISGRVDSNWVDHLLGTHGVFERPLFVSCGNGNVERMCFSKGLISSVTGFDIMPELIEEARSGAAEISMPASYSIKDGNRVELEPGNHDLVVNHAAGHHIAHLDHLLRQIHRTLTPNGVYVMLDYTGPHRNQYSWPAWEAIVESNAKLPAQFQTPVAYPHFATMLHLDPTEAIHSELIMEVTARYFEFEERVSLGGGLLHQLLFGKVELLKNQHEPDVQQLLEMLLEADRGLTQAHPETNLFTFAICRPKTGDSAPTSEQQVQWSAQEERRETAAAENGGRYYPAKALELIYEERAQLEMLTKSMPPAEPLSDIELERTPGSWLRQKAHSVRAFGRKLRKV